MTIGIYKIENLINHKCYIGQSVNIEQRWNKHRTKPFNPKDKGYEYPLYRAIRKYGLENFSFVILEECKKENLNEREVYWVDFYNSFFDGYNQTLGGDNPRTQISKEYVKGVIKDLEETDWKHSDIAKKWNVSTEMVQGINTGRYWHHDRDYPIQPKTKIRHQHKENRCIDCGKLIFRTATRCVECENKRRIKTPPVSREELKQLIRNTPFTTIGKSFGVTDNTIRKWCAKYNLPTKKRDIKRYTNEEWLRL